MNDNVFNGPPLPTRVRAAFAYLEYVKERLQPCCHPPGELSKQESATEVAALRTLVQFMTGEQEFADPVPPPPPPCRQEAVGSEGPAPREARAS